MESQQSSQQFFFTQPDNFFNYGGGAGDDMVSLYGGSGVPGPVGHPSPSPSVPSAPSVTTAVVPDLAHFYSGRNSFDSGLNSQQVVPNSNSLGYVSSGCNNPTLTTRRPAPPQKPPPPVDESQPLLNAKAKSKKAANRRGTAPTAPAVTTNLQLQLRAENLDLRRQVSQIHETLQGISALPVSMSEMLQQVRSAVLSSSTCSIAVEKLGVSVEKLAMIAEKVANESRETRQTMQKFEENFLNGNLKRTIVVDEGTNTSRQIEGNRRDVVDRSTSPMDVTAEASGISESIIPRRAADGRRSNRRGKQRHLPNSPNLSPVRCLLSSTRLDDTAATFLAGAGDAKSLTNLKTIDLSKGSTSSTRKRRSLLVFTAEDAHC